ncbi:MAG TPA: PadR family transcriptional regulator [Candidatus Didemnitutus sp.]|jgi:transcriptional regulator
MSSSPAEKSELLQGTLDMLILKALQREPMHGFGLSARLRTMSLGVFQVEMGSIYPALCRLEARGWVKADWKTSENNRRARFHALTPAGRKQLIEEKSRWDVLSGTINLMLDHPA